MKVKDIKNIVDKVYPSISKDYNCNAKVELFNNIFDRLDSIPATGEVSGMAEYHWDKNKIFVYTDFMKNKEDIVRSLIHESVHSNQSYELYEAYYECGLDYDTHPYELEAEYEEDKWEEYV
jgi:hypothetical protein|tara:strand:+ start:123 stop:485 length:363 start_codon:yes stop_codon:yes gene_type:complete